MNTNLSFTLDLFLGATSQGFKVMEWLRGVRDEHYRLSLEDPEAYKKMRREARESLRKKAKRTGRKIVKV